MRRVLLAVLALTACRSTANDPPRATAVSEAKPVASVAPSASAPPAAVTTPPPPAPEPTQAEAFAHIGSIKLQGTWPAPTILYSHDDGGNPSSHPEDFDKPKIKTWSMTKDAPPIPGIESLLRPKFEPYRFVASDTTIYALDRDTIRWVDDALVEVVAGDQRYLGARVPSLAVGKALAQAVVKKVKIEGEIRPEIVCGTPKEERVIHVDVKTGNVK